MKKYICFLLLLITACLGFTLFGSGAVLTDTHTTYIYSYDMEYIAPLMTGAECKFVYDDGRELDFTFEKHSNRSYYYISEAQGYYMSVFDDSILGEYVAWLDGEFYILYQCSGTSSDSVRIAKLSDVSEAASGGFQVFSGRLMLNSSDGLCIEEESLFDKKIKKLGTDSGNIIVINASVNSKSEDLYLKYPLIVTLEKDINDYNNFAVIPAGSRVKVLGSEYFTYGQDLYFGYHYELSYNGEKYYYHEGALEMSFYQNVSKDYLFSKYADSFGKKDRLYMFECIAETKKSMVYSSSDITNAFNYLCFVTYMDVEEPSIYDSPSVKYGVRAEFSDEPMDNAQNILLAGSGVTEISLGSVVTEYSSDIMYYIVVCYEDGTEETAFIRISDDGIIKPTRFLHMSGGEIADETQIFSTYEYSVFEPGTAIMSADLYNSFLCIDDKSDDYVNENPEQYLLGIKLYYPDDRCAYIKMLNKDYLLVVEDD